MQTKSKYVIVTGASSGIGKATAERFAREGWNVALVARRKELLEALHRELPKAHHLLCAGSYDDPATSDQLRARIQSEWGQVHALINCAGVFIGGDPITSPLEKWREPLDIMLNGAVYMTRLTVPLMPDGGRIVHVTSIHGDRVEKRASAYAMAKSALNQYCRSLAVELAPRNILVNAIAPGFVDTPMSIVDGVNELEGEWFKKFYVDGHLLPLRRAGQPEEIAGVAFFLAGPDASYLTGQVITVDGGLTITF